MQFLVLHYALLRRVIVYAHHPILVPVDKGDGDREGRRGQFIFGAEGNEGLQAGVEEDWDTVLSSAGAHYNLVHVIDNSLFFILIISLLPVIDITDDQLHGLTLAQEPPDPKR